MAGRFSPLNTLAKASVFTPEGWLNIDWIVEGHSWANFIMMLGARGTGKTFAVLRKALELEKNFILLRRTDKELKTIQQPRFNPLAPLNDFLKLAPPLAFFPDTEHSLIIAQELWDDKGKRYPGEERGLVLSLNGIGKIRGFSSSAEWIVFDEFVPEKTVRYVPDEANTFLNAVETIARNREIKGGEAVKCFLMGNSNRLANPILVEWHLIKDILAMRKKGQKIKEYREDGLLLLDITNSPISAQKKDTALYRLAAGRGCSGFMGMAIENKFEDLDEAFVVSRNLNNYSPVCGIGDITVYYNNSTDMYYVSPHRRGSPHIYPNSQLGRLQFRTQERYIYNALLMANVEFEDTEAQVLFHHYFNLDY